MTKIEPPLVEGEWVVAEIADKRGRCKVTTRVEGEVSRGGGTHAEIGGYAIVSGGWTILERRPPEPDWAGADAILVEWSNGNRFTHLREDDGTFDGSSVAWWLKRLDQPRLKAVSIRGLYLLDES